MGWFSKSTDGFFLATTTPPDIAASQYLGVVNGAQPSEVRTSSGSRRL